MKHADSILPADKKWKLVWQDEFDEGKLDLQKWDFRLNMMHRRHPAWLAGAVSFEEESSIRLELTKNGDQYASPHLQTGENWMDRAPEEQLKIFQWPVASFARPKFLKKYGYFECRCKLPTQAGWWAAFWLQSPNIGSTENPARSGIEVDIMENFTRNGQFSHNIFWNGYGSDRRSGHSGPRKLEKDIFGWHIFAVDWNRSGYVFYVDGKESWRFNQAVSHTEQFILISTECQSYRYDGQPAPELHQAVLPDAFTVDFVRVYDEIQ